MSLLLIQIEGTHREIALLEDGQLLEYHQSADAGQIKAEEIYLGRITRVMKNLQAAFVRLTAGQDGFLPFNEIPGGAQPMPGDILLVQVKKPPLPGKAAYMTAKLSLTGSLCMLLPNQSGISISKRIRKDAQRRELTQLARALAPQGMGLFLREESLKTDRHLIAQEIESLKLQFEKIKEKADSSTAPALILSSPDAVLRLLRDGKDVPQKILCNEPENLPDYGIAVTKTANPMQLYEVAHKLQKSLRRKIHLKSGATLMIDPCEAMTVIDVNTGQNIAGKDRARTLLYTNIEAAKEIARLLRLRRIGGIVLIDFIDMASSSEREEVLLSLQETLAKDPVKCSVHGFTSLGFLELTRKKTDEPLLGETLIPCPRCSGKGVIYKEEDELDA
ncbi:MAG: hypothetical protein GX781_09065 [Clostridiales bacterium]|nr:hypothetical protein [Clostridiales bacterium]